MFKSLILVVLLCFSAVANANSYFNQSNEIPVYVCTIRPFSETFADVGLSEDIARYKVSKRCQLTQGDNSIFCRANKASCIVSSLGRGYPSHNTEGVAIYADLNQTGQTVRINSDIADLSQYNFNNQMSSFSIPMGWTVRFYDGKHFSGDYYTRTGGYANATGFDNSISSIKVLSRH